MNYFIDCGVNRGQSIVAFVKNFQPNKNFNYIGFEPSIKPLKNKSQNLEMEKNIKEYSSFFNSFTIYEKAVGAKKDKRFFWYGYGAGSTGSLMKVSKMFLKDLSQFKFKKALRIFKFTIVEYIDLIYLIHKLNEKKSKIYLKLDIEGGEFEILEEMVKRKIFPNILLIEYHSKKANYPIKKTIKLHKQIFDNNVDIFWWSADSNPPLIKHGRNINIKYC